MRFPFCFFVPWLDTSKVRSATFRPLYKWFFWGFVVDCFILGYVGAYSPDHIFTYIWAGLSNQTLGQITTLIYFAFFLGALPLLGIYEKTKPLPKSLSEPVLRSNNEKKFIIQKSLFCLPFLGSLNPLYGAETPTLPHQEWSFEGPFGTYDRAELQHGFQIYKQVCSACHGLKQIRFRDLAALGYNPEEIKAHGSRI